jgi:hypothetical protein
MAKFKIKQTKGKIIYKEEIKGLLKLKDRLKNSPFKVSEYITGDLIIVWKNIIKQTLNKYPVAEIKSIKGNSIRIKLFRANKEASNQILSKLQNAGYNIEVVE